VGTRIFGALGVVAASVYLLAALRLPKPHFGDPVGPGAFPVLVAVGLFLSALGLLFANERHETEARAVVPAHSRLVLGGIAVWTAIYYSAFKPVGYLIATPAYLFALLAYLQRGRWIRSAAVAVAFTAGAYLVFDKLLGAALPQGLLRDLVP
jgi:putative tricarboxylic transport membrane protein